jgi:hypothetical protein
MKIFGPGSHTGGCVLPGFSWDKNGLNDFFEKISGRGILTRGGRDSDPGVSVSGLGLSVPLLGRGQGQGATAKRRPGRCAGAGALAGRQSKSKSRAQGEQGQGSRQAAAGWRLGEAGARAGDWSTEVREQRRAAAIRNDVRRHARDRLPLLHIPCPCVWACTLALVLPPGSGRRGHGCGAAVPPTEGWSWLGSTGEGLGQGSYLTFPGPPFTKCLPFTP